MRLNSSPLLQPTSFARPAQAGGQMPALPREARYLLFPKISQLPISEFAAQGSL